MILQVSGGIYDAKQECLVDFSTRLWNRLRMHVGGNAGTYPNNAELVVPHFCI